MPLLLFIIIPLIELYLIIVVGGAIGALWTVLLVILTAVIGVNLLRVQGLKTLSRAQRTLAHGQVPAMEMIEGIALAIAGLLLITPGFMTDALGFLLLLPSSRQVMVRYIVKRFTVRRGFDGQSVDWQSQQYYQQKPSQPQADEKQPESRSEKVGRTIEGEYRRED